MGLGNWFRRAGGQQPPTPSRDGGGAEAGHDSGSASAPAAAPEPEAGLSGIGAGRRHGSEGGSGEGEGDWDGGWRRVAPPAVTVARSSIGVSDGLRFRDGLASWQNLAFAGELGHAVLPSAPVGLIHGVARPGGARSTAPGGPLLLRAAPTGADGEAEAAAGPAPASAGRATGGAGDRTRGRSSAPTTVQRSSSTKAPRSSGDGAPGRQDRAGGATAGEAAGAAAPARSTARAGGTAPGAAATRGPATVPASQPATDTAPTPDSLRRAGPAAVRPRRTAPPLIIARRPAMTLRRIAGVLPPTASAQVTAAAAATAANSGDQQGSYGDAAPAAPTGAVPPTGHTAGRPTAAPVRPALGKPMRELPTGAVTPGPAASGGVVPSAPDGQEAAAMPVLQRLASDTAPPAADTPSPGEPGLTSRQRSSSDGRLPNSPAPQSSPRDVSGSPARARGGIGAPLTSLPSTARLQNDAPLLGDRRRVQPGSAPPPPTASSSPAAVEPVSKALNVPAEMPVRSSAAPARSGGSGGSAPEPAAVQRVVDPARPHTSLAAPSSSSSPSPSGPVAPVRIRRITPEREKGRATGPGVGSGAGGPAVVVQRSRGLLAGRALDVSTGSAEGFSAQRAAGGTARPVVAATWRRDVRQPGSEAPSSSSPSSSSAPSSPSSPLSSPPSQGRGNSRTGEGHRAQPDAARRPSVPHAPTRPADPTPTRRSRAAGPGATTGGSAPQGSAPGGTVQRLVSGNPAPGTSGTSGAPSARTVTRAPGRMPGSDPGSAPDARTGSGTKPDRRSGRGPGPARSLMRLVQRSPRDGAPGAPATTPSRTDAHPPEQGPTGAPAARRPGTPPPAARPAPAVAGTPPARPAARPVPVVRPHPPGTDRQGAAVVPVQRLAFPVVPESATPATITPMPESAGSVPSGPPTLAVRVPLRAPDPTRTTTHAPTPTAAPTAASAAGTRASRATAEVLQRVAADAGITGVPVRAVPVQRSDPPARTTPAGPDAPATGDPATANRVTATDIEELARRLIDPVSRLIRADLRRGRERTGRLYDGRR
ncbi:hypothetical protein [Streptomyces sp. NPDC057966]|uniref:hypothetical protein n=1 Tax=Streptomyces sp. NPDC057966 TaxID=3346292 RepID=UPI0036F13BD1